MPVLHLLRHAKAVRDAPSDKVRSLAPRGHADSGLLAGELADLGVRPELVLCSTATRTRETLAHLTGFLPASTESVFEDGLYLAERPALVQRLSTLPSSIGEAMLIGHNDGLWEAARWLAGAGDPVHRRALEAGLPTLGMVTLAFAGADWSDLDHGTCTLLRLWVPRPKD
jgi:phosphohistidine phosphatase